ncbi:ankyrin repeat domain-containing protein [Myxococcus sp. CA039A]|uniref:ankyrin repeat domain-containing protein n=1 Tax=Myxococcus sp. CA039A TaxID=2741737 RepID=UPI00157A39A0|nr:ankyrin repeat domain-containing protein [Myxococcus sp. CA039A]NTX51038.1 SMI1/KNR4 family protein [Myxococcus sp. CA039A]
MSPKKKLSKPDAALLSAVKKSNAKAVARHLADGADPNVSDDEGYPVLHTACAEGNLDVARLLLDAGADVKGLDSDSATPLGFATAQTGDDAVELVKLLIARGSDVNHQWKDEARSTVLTDLLNQETNEEPSAEVLKTLLRAGANPNITNGRGETPLMLSVDYKEQPELFELLLEHGAQVNAVDSNGRSVLMQAVRYGNVPVAERLISKGVDVNVRTTDSDGNTALTMALDLDEIFGDPSLVVLGALLRAGAKPNQPNARGWYALHYAASLEDVKFTTLLLEAGADPKAANAGGYYPIDTANGRGNTRVEKRLLAAGSPTLEQAASLRAESVWKRIGAWAARRNPTYAEQLASTRPSTEARVVALEKALGTPLPLDFRAFLLRFGGGAPAGTPGLSVSEYEVLPVDQILSTWKGLRKLVEKGTFKKAEPHELSKSQKDVKWTWWHPGWVPFAQDGGGNLKCVDLDPGPEGKRGQVIGWEIRGGPLSPYAPSMDAFFEHYLEGLETGRIELYGDEEPDEPEASATSAAPVTAPEPPREGTAAERVEALSNQLGAWYEEHHAPYAQRFARTKSASQQQVDALDKSVGAELPAGLQAFLLRFGGGAPDKKQGLSFFTYQVLSVKEITDLWTQLETHRESGAFAKSKPLDLTKGQKELTRTWWSAGWIPFAKNDHGEALCVDLTPGPAGRRGQVLRWSEYAGPLDEAKAPSLEDYFADYLKRLRDKRWYVRSDSDDLLSS